MHHGMARFGLLTEKKMSMKGPTLETIAKK
jgi:hypothetical protein